MDVLLIVWAALFVLFAITEAFTVQLVSIWFAAGSLVAFFTALCGGELWLQLVLFVAVSVILLVLVRPATRKLLNNKVVPTNVDSFIGKKGVITEAVDNIRETGKAMIDGLDWTVVSVDDSKIPKDAIVEIVEIRGIKAVVKVTAE